MLHLIFILHLSEVCTLVHIIYHHIQTLNFASHTSYLVVWASYSNKIRVRQKKKSVVFLSYNSIIYSISWYNTNLLRIDSVKNMSRREIIVGQRKMGVEKSWCNLYKYYLNFILKMLEILLHFVIIKKSIKFMNN